MDLEDKLKSYDNTLYNSLQGVIRSCEEIWKTPLLPWFTCHGISHSKKLISLLGQILSHIEETPVRLNKDELFILLTAVYLHDIGMQFLKLEDIPIDQLTPDHYEEIRKRHAVESYNLIMKNTKILPRDDFHIFRIDEQYLPAIANVSKGHATDYFVETVRYFTQHPAKPHNEAVRGAYLTTLLIIADELDLQSSRVDFSEIPKFKLSDVSSLHWYKHHYVDSIEINNGIISIRLKFPPKAPFVEEHKYSVLIKKLIYDKLNDQIKIAIPILEKASNGYLHLRLNDIEEIFDPDGIIRELPDGALQALKNTLNKEVPDELGNLAQAEKLNVDGIATSSYNNENILRNKRNIQGILGKYNSKFIGRNKEISELMKSVQQHRLVTLLATGGIGKTRLALEVVRQMEENNLVQQGIAVVPLDEVMDDTESAVLDVFVEALKLAPELCSGEKNAILNEFKNEQTVLLLDNCETAPNSLANLVDVLLRDCPHLRILATSQKALGLRGVEQTFFLEPMLPPKSEVLTLSELEMLDSFQLFKHHACLADSAWHPENQDAPAIAEILRLTDGIPLAIEFVAAWMPLRSLIEITKELRRTPLGNITSAQDAIDIQAERHRSLMRCLDWSFNLLDKWVQDGFAGLGVFADTFTVNSVEFICERPDAQKILDSLVKMRLVYRLSYEEVSVYTMLRFTRIYANTKFKLLPNAHSVRKRFVSYFVEMANESGMLKRHGKSFAFNLEWKNALAATKIAEEIGNKGALFPLSKYLGEFLLRKGLWAEREKLNFSALKAARELRNEPVERCILVDLGTVLECQGRWNEAKERYKDSLIISTRLESVEGQAIAWEHLGELFQREGKTVEAEDAYRRRTELRKNECDLHRKAFGLDKDGKLLERSGKLDEAAQKYFESWEIRKKTDDKSGQIYSLSHIGDVFTRQRRWEEAESAYKESIKICHDVGDNHKQAATIYNLGKLYQAQGKFIDAEANYIQSLEMRKNIIDPKGEALTRCTLGGMYRIWGNWAKAEEMTRKSLEIGQKLSDLEGQSISLNELGLLYIAQERWQDAVSALEDSLKINQKRNDPIGDGITLDRLAQVYYYQKKWTKYETALLKSLALSEQAGQHVQAGITLMHLALLHASQGLKSKALPFAQKAVSVLEGAWNKKCYSVANDILSKLERRMSEGHPWNAWDETDYQAKAIFVRRLAKHYRDNNQWVDAEREYKQNLEKCLEKGDRIGEGITLNELGSVYRKQQKFAEAENTHRKALNIFSQHSVSDGQAACHHKLGNLYGEQKQWVKAETAYKESMSIRCNTHSDIGEAITLDRLADIYQQQKLYDEAEKMYQQSLSIVCKIGTATQKWETFRRFVLLRKERGDTPGALALAREVITLLEKSKNTRFLAEAQTLLGRLSQEKGTNVDL